MHGHRTNTLAAFAYAIEVGVDAIELDIQVAPGGVLVVSHDPVAGDCTLPTVAEVLALAAPHRVELNLELKPQLALEPLAYIGLLLPLLREHKMEPRVMVQSFDFRVLQAMRELAPDIRCGALVEDDDRDFVTIAKQAGDAHYVGPQFGLVTPEKVRQAHAVGIQVLPWTVNAPGDWARMAEAGVDGIITDAPAALIEWLSTAGLQAGGN